MDVGVDAAFKYYGEFRPFDEMEIYDRLSVKKGHDDLEFYKEYQKCNRK